MGIYKHNCNIIKTILTALILLVGKVLYAQDNQGNSDIEAIKILSDKANEYRENNEPIKLAQTLGKMALIYVKIKDNDKAIKSYQQSVSLYLQNEQYNQARIIYSNIGFLYTDNEEYENALKYMKNSLVTAKFQKNDTCISAAGTDVAYILMLEKEYQVAINQLLESLKIAQSIKNRQLIIKCYAMLMDCYRALGINTKYMEYQNKLNSMTQHNKEEITKKVVGNLVIDKKAAEERSELERKNRELERQLSQQRIEEALLKNYEDSLKNAKKLLENEMKNRQWEKTTKILTQKNIRLEDQKRIDYERQVKHLKYAGILLFFLLTITLLLWNNIRNSKKFNKILIRNNKIIDQKNLQLEQKAKELAEAYEMVSMQKQSITDSILYAEHIQMSMLINKELIQETIPQLMIFFRPKNVVSGDFYWYHYKGNKSYIAAIDCTGHGVPGAMISMIGYNILENIMINSNLEHPNEIMDQLHLGIRKMLRQDTTNNHDGMDMALCMIDHNNKTLEYSGAKNALIIARPYKDSIKIKANSFGVGGRSASDDDIETQNIINLEKFTNHNIEIYDDATYYISSDGFSDQFGGPKNKKYMIGHYRSTLSNICRLPIEKQEAAISKELDNWQGDNEQTDDILIIGFKVAGLIEGGQLKNS